MTTENLVQKKQSTCLQIQIEALNTYINQTNEKVESYRSALSCLEKCELGLAGEEKAYHLLTELCGSFPMQILQDVSFRNVSDSDKTTQIDLLLITDKIVFVIEVKNWDGEFVVENGVLKKQDKYNSDYGCDNPYEQNEYHIKGLKDVLLKGGFENICFANVIYWANEDGNIEFVDSNDSKKSAEFEESYFKSENLISGIMGIYESADISAPIEIGRISQYINSYCSQNSASLFCPVCKSKGTENRLTFIPNPHNGRNWFCTACGYSEIDRKNFVPCDFNRDSANECTQERADAPTSSCDATDADASMRFVREYVLTEDEYKKMLDAYEDVPQQASVRGTPKKWHVVFSAITAVVVSIITAFSIYYFWNTKPCTMCTEMGLYRFTEKVNELFHDYFVSGFGKPTALLLIALFVIGLTGLLTGVMELSLCKLLGGSLLRDKVSKRLPNFAKLLPTYVMMLYFAVWTVWLVIDDTVIFEIRKYEISLTGENYTIPMWITQIAFILMIAAFVVIFVDVFIGSGFIGSLIQIPVLIVSNCSMILAAQLVVAVAVGFVAYAVMAVVIGAIILSAFLLLLRILF
ncbi:MAG: NERD domain-containing protein [Ruminococcus sp.]|nr:NERD domain-containing protein [Ruminococcus sp.]